MLTIEQLQKEFTVLGFAYGMCIVERKSDKTKGTFLFGTNDDGIRIYHSYQETN